MLREQRGAGVPGSWRPWPPSMPNPSDGDDLPTLAGCPAGQRVDLRCRARTRRTRRRTLTAPRTYWSSAHGSSFGPPVPQSDRTSYPMSPNDGVRGSDTQCASPSGSWAIVAGPGESPPGECHGGSVRSPESNQGNLPIGSATGALPLTRKGLSVEGRPQTSQGAVVLRHSAFWSQVVDDGRKGGRDSLLGLLLGHTCVLRDLLDTISARGSC